MQPRDFFIEDYLERNRFQAECNLGESGIRNLQLGELFQKLGLSMESWSELSLADSPNRGRESLRRQIASLYGESITEENVLVTTGTSEALYLFFHLLLSPGKSVRILTPAFQSLYEIPTMLGADIRGYDLTLNKLSMKSFCNDSFYLHIINHPHNPTGRGLAEDDWEYLQEFIPKSSSYFLFDEHYRFLDFSGELTRSGVHLGEKCFATGSVTKCFGVVGLKIGWLVGDKKFLDKARSFKDYLTHTVNPLSEFLCEKILIHRKKLIQPIRESIRSNICYFQNRFHEFTSLMNFNPPDGGLVSFISLKDSIQSEDYADRLMEDESVFILPGKSFEREGFIRIGFGEEESKFQNGIDRWISWDRKIYGVNP